MGHARLAVEMLTSADEAKATEIATYLEQQNRARQAIERKIFAQAVEQVTELKLDGDGSCAIVLGRDDWHAGVIGIVASRVVEETGRPAVLIALDGDEGKGSGRSIPAFDLHAGLGECRDLLIRYGGHRSAAGVTIASERVEAFAERFNEVARERLSADDLVPEMRVDLEIAIDDANTDLEALLRHFEPFGMGNPSPVLVARGVSLLGAPRLVGQDGLKLRLRTGTGELEALGWGMGARASEFRDGDSVDVAFRLERDEWNGVSRLVAKLADVRGPSRRRD
jgi:single-stranded-DNA-specific exonuclease